MWHRLARISLLCLLGWMGGVLAAEVDPSTPLARLGLQTWDTARGLPTNTVVMVYQARDGHLWAATMTGGLVRMDGARVDVFNRSSVPQLTSPGFWSITEAPDGTLYFGSIDGRVFTYVRGGFGVLPQAPGHQGKGVFLFQSRRGPLLAFTYAAGDLLQWDGRAWGPLGQVTAALRGVEITSLLEDREGRLWVGTRTHGLWRTAGEGLEPVPDRDGAAIPQIMALAQDQAGHLWVGSYQGGVWRSEAALPTTPGLRFLPVARPSPRVNALLAGPSGEMWIGADSGVFRFQRAALDQPRLGESAFQGSTVNSLAFDHEGGLWMGTWRNGLTRLVAHPFQVFGTAEGLPALEINAVAEGRDGRIWIATRAGLAGLDREDRALPPLDHTPMGSDRTIKDLLVDRRGGLWVGGRAGLFRLAGGRLRKVPLVPAGPPPYARVLLEDRHGALWVGTTDGLCRWKDGAARWWYERDGLSNGYVLSLTEDRRGALWVGTRGGGITILEGGRSRRLGSADGLPSDVVFRTYEDPQGTLWIGTQGGLARWKEGHFSCLGARGGLPSEAVYEVLEDGLGNLWLATSAGPVRIPKAALEAYLDGRSRSLHLRIFDESDGLRKAEINSLSHNLRDTRGRLWFATLEGAARLDPRRPDPPVLAPPLAFAKVVQGPRSFAAEGSNLEIPGPTPVEIHYKVLAFRAPQRVRFRYQLMGIDPEPVEAGERRVAYYSTLPPRRSLFRVWAYSELEGWTSAPAELALFRPALWHETWTFRGAALLGLLGAPYGAFRWRLAQARRGNTRLQAQVREATGALETVNRELEDRVRERTGELRDALTLAQAADQAKTLFLARMGHELRTPVNQMVLVAQLIQAEWPEAAGPPPRGDFEAILEAGHRLERLIADLLDFSALEAGGLRLEVAPFHPGPCLRELEVLYAPLARKKGLDFSLEAEGLPDTLHGDAGRLCQVAKDLLSNAIKFTEHGGVCLRARWTPVPARLRLEVEDTGPGIPETHQASLFAPFEQGDGALSRRHGGTGLGLAIAKRLVDLMGGDIGFEPRPEGGTRFWVEVALLANRKAK